MRSSFSHLIALLLFSYFPFLSQIPSVNEPLGENSIPIWKKVGAFFWLLIIHLGISLSDVITDLLFSLELLRLHDDPILDRRDELFIWMIVSFVATCMGALLWLVRISSSTISFLQKGELTSHSLLAWMVERSPFGVLESGIELILIGMSIFFEDMIQLVVAANTLRFIGKVDGLWGFKLGISILSSCFSMGGLLSRFLFDSKRSKKLQMVVRVSFFALFAIGISIIVGMTIGRDFCSLSRTVKDGNILEALGGCDSIGNTIVIQNLDRNVDENLNVLEMNGTMTLVDNPLSLSLSFQELKELNGKLLVMGNAGEMSLLFPKLNVLNQGSELRVENNSEFQAVSLGFLLKIESDSSLFFSGNTILNGFNLESLFSIDGEVNLVDNEITTIEFDSLFNIVGNLTFLGNQIEHLAFQSLNGVDGELKIVENSLLKFLAFHALESFPGSIFITQNQHLERISFTNLVGVSSLVLLENQKLHDIHFGNFSGIVDLFIISENPSLREIILPFESGLYPLDAEISQNQSLVSLTFPRLDCSYVFQIKITNNTNLEVIWIPSSRCTDLFTLIGNPKVRFEYLNP